MCAGALSQAANCMLIEMKYCMDNVCIKKKTKNNPNQLQSLAKLNPNQHSVSCQAINVLKCQKNSSENLSAQYIYHDIESIQPIMSHSTQDVK